MKNLALAHSQPALPEPPEPAPSGFKAADLAFILFRHKWKILGCTLAGLAAAGAFYLLLPPVYESEAKLLVRYVVDRSAIDKMEPSASTSASQTDNQINSEIEILTSTDVAMQTAEAVGVTRILGKNAKDPSPSTAARAILHGMTVVPPKESNVITVSYRNEDPKLPAAVLHGELIDRYFERHLEVHRSVGAFELVTRETDKLRAQLAETEARLKTLKAQAGVISLAETATSLEAETAHARDRLDIATADLAEQSARVEELTKAVSATGTDHPEGPGIRPPPKAVEEYQNLTSRVTFLRQSLNELLAKYTAGNPTVKATQAQLERCDARRRELEGLFPTLTAVAATAAGVVPGPDLPAERAKLSAIQNRVDTLKTRMSELQDRATVLAEAGPQIAELERTKEVQETNYKSYTAGLEKARLDETLDPTRIPNISIVQQPSMPARATRNIRKVVMAMAGGGAAVGFAIAFFMELVFDRTVKRPGELEEQLQIPLLLSIPELVCGESRRLSAGSRVGADVLPSDSRELSTLPHDEMTDLLRPFCETLRDRLTLSFDLGDMPHKPKLVALTSITRGAGVSSVAAGLATALGTGPENKVLFIDRISSPKGFYDLIMRSKEGNFEYIVFDLPSLGDDNATLAMAGFMDKVLLVVEEGKTSRDALKRVYERLSDRTNVSVVFNRKRLHGPKWLDGRW